MIEEAREEELLDVALLKNRDDRKFLREHPEIGMKPDISEEHTLNVVLKMFNEDNLILVAKEKGKVIGYLTADYTPSGCRINGVYVLPERRRKGIATSLHKRLFEISKRFPIYSIIYPGRTAPLELTKSLGFTQKISEYGGIEVEYNLKK